MVMIVMLMIVMLMVIMMMTILATDDDQEDRSNTWIG